MTAPGQGADHDPSEPTAWLRRFLADRRPPLIVGLLAILFSVMQTMVLVSQNQSAIIKSDSYSYLVFAKELAGGSFRMTGVLADTVGEFAENEEVVPGPIWNTHVTPEGRTVFTIAIGYPLVLSIAWILGGVWLVFQLNIVLLFILLLLLGACLWDRLGRDVVALSVAGCTVLIFVCSRPETFLQFSAPWREPLFYICVIGATWAVAVYASSGCMRAMAVAGLLLGYACAVKESSIVYAFVLGICVVFFRRPLRVRFAARAAGVYAVCGVIGVMPLLLQNTLATGNPFRSLQAERATGGVSMTGPQPGWSPGNIPYTIDRYAGMYVGEFGPHLLIAMGVLALIGFLVGRRVPIVRAMGMLLAMHVVVYAPWGNADFRHSYFAHIPLSLYCALGLVHLLMWATRPIPCIELYRYWVPLVPLILLAAKPPLWQIPENPPFAYRDAVSLTAEIEQAAGEGAVLLSNRELRNILDVYGSLPAIRLHDLAGFHPDGDVKKVIQWLLDRDRRVIFLDNRDQDPRNYGRVDWARKDQAWLLQDFDLIPAFTVPRDQHGLKSFLDEEKPGLTAFQVASWTNAVVRRSLEVPEEGAAFLFVNPRNAGQALEIALGEATLTGSSSNDFYVPVRIAPGEDVMFEASAGGAPIPLLADSRLIGWHEEIGEWLGTDAIHSDAAFFPDGVDNRIDDGSRYVTNFSVRMRVPVRQGPDFFTTIGLKVEVKPADAKTQVDLPNGEQFTTGAGARVIYFPVHLPPGEEPRSGHTIFRIHTDEPSTMKLTRVESYASRTRIAVSPPADALGMGLTGQLTPTAPDPGPHEWSVRIDGTEFRHAKCMADPGRTWNRLALAVGSAGRTTPIEIEFEGAGLIASRWVSVGNRMNLTPSSGLDAFVEEFNKKETDFWWSKGESRVRVPVRKEHPTYRLILDFANGRPGKKRPLTIRFAGFERIVEPPDQRAEQEITIAAVDELTDGLELLQFFIDAWQPESDSRTLGFQLFGLEWSPVD